MSSTFRDQRPCEGEELPAKLNLGDDQFDLHMFRRWPFAIRRDQLFGCAVRCRHDDERVGQSYADVLSANSCSGDGRFGEALAKPPFLGAVCDESLRVRPIITDVLRTLLVPFEYGGFQLPAGVAASVAIEAIHSDPTLYPEPYQFRPERFLERKFSPFEFLPFGGEHRRCLGAAFSNCEARIVLGTLVSRVALEPMTRDTRVRRNVTMGPKHGVPVRVARLR